MEKIKGVNLGGWLVLEKWMSPRLFEGTEAEDEYYLAHDLSKEEYQARMLMHRAEFITEADFLRLSAEGINLVRLPVPYFVFGDREPFIGCLKEIDHAFEWAKAYDIQIMLDLHTVPYSQNGFDNGGLSGVCRWAQLPEEVDFALSVLSRLAERYKNHTAFWGIEIINEPITEKMWHHMNPMTRYKAREPKIAEKSAPITLDFLYDFYQEAYRMLRDILPREKVIVFHDGFELHAWEKFFKKNKFVNVMLDTHQYVMFAELEGTEQHLDSYVAYLRDLGNQIKQVQSYVPVFVGEWSLFNSYAIGVDTKGGINPTQETFESRQKLNKEELKTFYNVLWQESVAAWNKGEGYVY